MINPPNTQQPIGETIGKAGIVSIIIGALVYVIQNVPIDEIWKRFLLQYVIPLLTLAVNHYTKSLILWLEDRRERKLKERYKDLNEKALGSKNISPQKKKIIKNNLETLEFEEITDLERELNRKKISHNDSGVTN